MSGNGANLSVVARLAALTPEQYQPDTTPLPGEGWRVVGVASDGMRRVQTLFGTLTDEYNKIVTQGRALLVRLLSEKLSEQLCSDIERVQSELERTKGAREIVELLREWEIRMQYPDLTTGQLMVTGPDWTVYHREAAARSANADSTVEVELTLRGRM